MKYSILFVMATLVSLLNLTIGDELKVAEQLQKALNTLPLDLLPAFFRQVNYDDNSHWCCKIDMPSVLVDGTRVVTFTIQSGGKYRCGYEGCGFLGWGRCTKWCEHTWIDTLTHVETYTVSEAQACPNEFQVCCKDHFLINGHCFDIGELQGNPEMMAILAEQGIFLPVGRK